MSLVGCIFHIDPKSSKIWVILWNNLLVALGILSLYLLLERLLLDWKVLFFFNRVVPVHIWGYDFGSGLWMIVRGLWFGVLLICKFFLLFFDAMLCYISLAAVIRYAQYALAHLGNKILPAIAAAGVMHGLLSLSGRFFDLTLGPWLALGILVYYTSYAYIMHDVWENRKEWNQAKTNHWFYLTLTWPVLALVAFYGGTVMTCVLCPCVLAAGLLGFFLCLLALFFAWMYL
jgi:hypothetical protein